MGRVERLIERELFGTDKLNNLITMAARVLALPGSEIVMQIS